MTMMIKRMGGAMKRGGTAALKMGPGRAFPVKPSHVLLVLLLVLIANVNPASGAGGDILWQRGHVQADKQQANASAVDSTGNVIVTGFSNGGGVNDNFHTAKIKSDGSGVAWSAAFDKAGGSDVANAVAVDANNDVIVTGYVWNGLNNDIHTIKYNGATGAVIWQHTFNGAAAGGDYGTAVTVDSLNNVYVVGYTANASGNDDFIMLKYSPAGGSPLWQAVYNGTANGIDRALSAAAGPGGVAVTGYSWNGTDFDCLTAMYGPTGNKIWETRKAAAGVRDDRGVVVKQDASGNVAMAGYISNATDHDIYVAKYNAATGAVTWEYTYAGTGGDDEPKDLAVDALGEFYVTGFTWTPTGSFDIYTARFLANGTKSWERVYNSNNGDDDLPVGIVTDAGGNVFVSGYSFVQSGGHFDFRTLKLSKDNGTVLWHVGFNGAAGKNEKGVGIAVAPGNGIYAIGWSDMWTSGASDYDYYVVKYDAGLLDAPIALTTEVVSNSAVDLFWTDNAGNEDGFKIERKLGEGGTWAEIATVGANVVTYSDTGLTASTRYFYRVRAYNAANGNSLYTNEVSAYTLLVTPVAPAWTYTYASSVSGADDYATGVAVGPDYNPVVTGHSLSTNELLDSFNFYTIKLNRANNAVIWAKLYDDPGNASEMYPVVAVDRNNDVVIAGTSPQDGGGDEDTDDIFSMKYVAASGAEVWGSGKWFGNNAFADRADVVAITEDGQNKVFVVGHGKNAGGTNDDIKVMKYNPDGTNAWGAPVVYDGGGNDLPTAAAIDPAGNLIVTGYRQSSGVNRWFTAKFAAADGTILWNKTFAGIGAGPDQARAVGVDKSGNAYVAGYVVNGAGNEDFYTIRYNSADGTIGWQMGHDGDAAGNDRAVALTVDPVDENVIVSGNVYISGGNSDVHTIRYAPSDGEELWMATLDRPSTDDHAVAMGMDPSGNFYIAGVTATGANGDLFSTKYGYDGTLLGMTTYGTANADAATSIAVNGLGEAFVAGNVIAAGGDADYIVYKVSSTSLQAPLPVSSVPDYAKIVVNWTDNSTTENGYTLQRKLGTCSSGNPWVNVAALAANVATYTDTFLNPTTTYCYRVRASRNDGELSRWGEKAFTTLTPTPPGAFAATIPSTTQVNLTWTDNTTGEGGFMIERCIGANCDFSVLDATFTTAANVVLYNDVSVCAGNTYSYRVKAFKAGEWDSAYTVLANRVLAAPGVPAAFSATATNEAEVALSWTDTSADETGFKVERCSGAGCSDFSQIGTVAAGVTTFKDSMVASGGSYSYRVRSYKTAGCSWNSDYSSTSTVATVVTNPSGLTATVANTTEINLAWADNTGSETGFRIDRCLGAGCSDFAPLTTTGPSVTTYKDASVCNGSTYQYRVTARNEGLSKGGGGCWTRRKPVTITNFQDDYPTKIVVAFDADMKADFSDVRFFDTTTLRELPYWIESKTDSSTATIWVKTTRSNTVTMYYGNASATSSSNGAIVFDVFDDFDTLAAWNQSGATITVANSTATLDYGSNPSIYRNFNVPVPFSAELRYQHPVSYRNRLYLTTAAGSGSPIGYDFGVFSGYFYWNGTNVLALSNSTWYVLRWDNTETDYIWRAYNNAGTQVASRSHGQPIAGLSRMFIAGTENTNSDMVLDWFRVRKYVATEPTVTLGTEETSGCYVFTGTWDSGPTGTAAATTGSPAAPGGISSTAVSEVQINLAWTDTNSDESAYVLERCTGAGCSDFSQIASLAPGSTSYNSTGLVPSTTYTYRVRAAKTASCGWDSATSVTAATTGTVPAPAGLTATVQNTTTVRASWTDNTGSETAFQLERCSGGGCSDFAKIVELDPNTSSYDDTGACAGTAYSYRVRAINEGFGRGNGGCWTRRAPVTITNFQQNVQMKIVVTYDADMKSDFSDIRFYDTTDSKELPYWIESKTDGVAATVWLKTGNNNTVSVYYGNGAAASTSNSANTFDFFDDFTGSAIDTTKWTVTDGTGFSVSGGFLHGTNTTGRLTSKTNYGAGTVLEIKAKTPTIATNGHAVGGFYASAANNIGWLNHPNNAYYINNGSYTAAPSQTPANTMLYTMSVIDASTTNLQVYNLDTSAMFWNIGNLSHALGSKPIVIGYRYDNTLGGQAYVSDWDWIRVRKYVATAPTATVGAEEQSGCFTFGVTWNSAYSGTASATTTTPTLPTLTATRGSESTINLSWNNSTSDETGFAIQRCTGSGCVDFADLTTTATDVITYADSLVAPATTYTYRVAPLKTASCSWPVTYSAAAAATTTVTGPSGLTATTANSTQINLAWTDNTGSETAFRIERCAGAGCTDFVEIGTAKPDVTTYADTSVCKSTLYRYQVRASNTGLSGSGGGCWTVRAPLTITNFQPNHQTKLVVPWRTGMQSDFRDVRFYDAVHQRELSYYIESKTNGVTATMWVKTRANNSIFMYYGNASAAAVSNGNDTFEFFDDFAGTTVDTTKWTLIDPNGNYSQNNEFIVSGGTASWNGGIHSVKNFTRPFVMEFQTYVTGGAEVMLGVKDNTTQIPYTNFTHVFYLANTAMFIYEDGNSRGSVATITGNTWQQYRVEALNVGARYYFGNVGGALTKYYDNTTYGSVATLKVGFANASRAFKWDNVIVRKYAAVDPTVAIGSDETSGCFAIGTWDTGYSTIAQATTTTPPTPTLTLTRISEAQLNLSWTDGVADETGFHVERCSGASCSGFAEITTTAANGITFTDYSVQPLTDYSYRVASYKNATCSWNSTYSAVKTATTTVSAPTALAAVPANTTTINLSWTDNTGAESGYTLQRCAGAACTDFTTIALVGQNVTTYVDANVCNTSQYRYRVTAQNEGLSFPGGGCWTRRAPITITNFQPNFQVRLVLPYDSDMKADFSDIRFYDGTFQRELPYWIESKTDGVSAIVWLKTGLNNNIHLYYGNAAATASNSNGTNVFEFFDDFAGTTINTSRWTQVGSYFTQNDKLISTSGSGGWTTGIYTVANFARPFVVEFDHYYDAESYAMVGLKNTGAGVNYTDLIYAQYLIYDGGGNRIAVYEAGTGRADNLKALASGAWQYFRFDVLPSAGATYYHGTSRGTYTTVYNSTYNSVSPLKFGISVAYESFKIDNLRVRKYAAVEPALTVGAEETSGCYVFSGTWTSGDSNIATATTVTPGPPTGLVATASTDTRINLTWTDNTSDESGFRIERCTGAACSDFAQIATTAANVATYSDTTVVPSTTYRYQVRTTKTAFCGWDTPFAAAAADQTFPATAGSLTATPLNSLSVKLDWVDNAGDEEGYEVQMQAATGKWASVTTLPADTETYTQRFGLDPALAYNFRVRPYRGADKSPFTTTATATTPAYQVGDTTCP